MVNIGVIGCGYWGPNLIRNFVTSPDTELIWACDLDKKRLERISKPYPNVRQTTDMNDIFFDDAVDAVAVATPVNTHYPIAKACLENGKHVLLEKPLASSVSEGRKLVELARKNRLQLMCDHTFCYTSAIRKIKEVVKTDILGELHYLDSVRINLGLFQHDVNVVWDLAPHDLSIADFIIGKKPTAVSAHGVSHINNDIENIAYVSLRYEDSFIAHFHLNWLSPVKIRTMILCGKDKMLVWNDLEPDEKIKIYDKGISFKKIDQEEKESILISYRSGDMFSPQIDQTEALFLVVKEFAESITENRPPLTDGLSGLRVLYILEAAQKSIKENGNTISIEYS